MKYISALVVIVAICAADAHTEEPQTRRGELALVEIVSWGAHSFESGDEVGYLHARTIETNGQSLPSQFRLSFKRALSSKSDPTPWSNLPAGSDGRLGIHNGEWIIGRFTQTGDSWEVISGEKDFDLSRPEDMTSERLERVQAQFSTLLIRVWVPENDLLADTFDRVQWRMSEAEFKRAFAKDSLIEGKWSLSRRSFRKTMVVRQPNTEILFEFSGVVDNKSTDVVPLSSSLVSFQVKHPLKPHPETSFRRPPQSIHYRYLKKLHDACVLRFENSGTKYEHEGMSHGGTGNGYMLWERIVCDTAGTMTFIYWSNTSDEGIIAQAPQRLIAEDLRKERYSAAQATKDWPIPDCGNDFLPRMELPQE